LHFPLDRSVHIGDLRLALVTSLWAWSKKGVIVATDNSPGALDDLEWLDVAPDETVGCETKIATQAMVEQLLAENKAYYCYCTPAELRELPAAPRGYREGTLYDGRCRSLSAQDQKALGKAGRKPTVRLRTADNPGEGLPKRLQAHLPKRGHDFVICEADGTVTTEFAAALNDHKSEATHVLLHEADLSHLHQRILIANALGISCPQFSTIADVEQTGGEGGRWQTIGHLRDAGFHPDAVRSALLSAGFASATDEPVKTQAKKFTLAKLSKNTAAIDMNALEQSNAEVLQDMSNNDQVDAIFAHLARRGFNFEGRDKRWQKKFVDLVVEDLHTLADAESMAGYALTAGVSYEKRAAELLREDATQNLIDHFEKCIKKGKSSSLKDWKSVFAKFRGEVDVPGRALSTIRVVLTGERSGPNLAILATLLGEAGTRDRLEKARKYRSR
jgi:nondiscriminating glutamyl-tRNA synthetase